MGYYPKLSIILLKLTLLFRKDEMVLLVFKFSLYKTTKKTSVILIFFFLNTLKFAKIIKGTTNSELSILQYDEKQNIYKS